ncbi:MAG: 1-deoxy-D-xylulose-5-phosphate synthase [Clostridiaceae bacterium]|nr:1-deoxy-D-xylulose-5-phosphate synthase [Clostridiaceae bacterium]
MQQDTLLSSLKSVDDIATLSYDDKEVLAEDIRRQIIDTVSKTGGHLAPNLGVVELTIALLSVFDVPKDSIVFDVGHQCYSWKMLTGRLNAFSTLRQKDGLSGFPKREESPYDAFNTGHSSTSISACAGIARAKRLRGDTSRTIALIGDGAIENGLALEALSDIGEHEDNVLVILNDNQMCIDRAAGGIANHLDHLRTSTRYLRMKPVWERRLNKIPLVGHSVVRQLARLKRRWRTFRRESSIIFEQLGFRYYGPVDGHDLRELERHLQALCLVRGPVLLHVITQKGKGYAPAEESPEDYHGVSAFDKEEGVTTERTEDALSFSEVFGDTMMDIAAKRRDVAVIVAAMARGTGLSLFAETYPERFWDVGIAEEHAVTMAAGMASAGIHPVVALYSTFLQRAFDEMLHDVCLQNLPVIFAVDRAGLVGGDGATHQGLYDLAYALTLPNLTVFAPSTAPDLRKTLKWAVEHDGPVLIRYPKSAASLIDLSQIADVTCARGQTIALRPEGRKMLQDDATDALEKGHLIASTTFDISSVLKSSNDCQTDVKAVDTKDESLFLLRRVLLGNDLTVVALGPCVLEALQACQRLMSEKSAYTIELFSCVSAMPFDYKSVIHSIHKTNKLLIIEDSVERGGFGSMIAAELARRCPGCFVNYAGVTHLTRGAASREELIALEKLDATNLKKRMRQLIEMANDAESSLCAWS